MNGRNLLHQGDCIAGILELPDGCVDLVFADPPFNIGYEYDTYDDRKAADDYLDWSRQWMEGVKRALKSDGTILFCLGIDHTKFT
jgi:site-specific DNA-methyltransferase (adenine-specific)